MADMDKVMNIPPKYLNKNSHYAWVTDEKRMLTAFKSDGYVTVKVSDPEGVKLKESDDPRAGVDGLIRSGDAILMKCPKELKMKRDADRAKRSGKAAAEQTRREFHEYAASQGLRSFEETSK